MNATFFVLAFAAALNPKLLALDLLLVANRRPRAMFAFVLLGGLTVALTVGLLDVLVVRLDALHALDSQRTVSAGVDLTLGLLLLAAGALVATGRLHGRRQTPAPAAVPVPASPPVPAAGPPGKQRKWKKDDWAQRLAEPRLGLALLIGAVIGIPGASYLTGLHILITSKSSTASQVVGVILFVVIEFLLILIPWALVELRPEATEAALRNAQGWLLGHARQLLAYTALILGAYLAVSGLVRLA